MPDIDTGGCRGTGDPDAIVVCARGADADRFRIPVALREGGQAESGMPRAQVSLSDGTSAAIRNEQADVGGFPSNRIFVTLSTAF